MKLKHDTYESLLQAFVAEYEKNHQDEDTPILHEVYLADEVYLASVSLLHRNKVYTGRLLKKEEVSTG